jgi:hypothetical protein
MNRLTQEQIKNIKSVEKIKLTLKTNILLLPPPLKRSKRVTKEWLQRYELKCQKEKKLKELIKKSIREKCSETLYNHSNKICRDIARYIATYVI